MLLRRNNVLPSPTNPVKRRTRQATRLIVEVLEDRTLLAVNLRIATYNINVSNRDIAGDLRDDLRLILQSIGSEQNYFGDSRPIDVLLLQEVSLDGSDATEVANLLNEIYLQPGLYAPETTPGEAATFGTQMLVYRTSTVQLLDAPPLALGEPGPSGPARQTVRYHLRPIGFGSTNDFYVYNSHYKSGNGKSNAGIRDRDRRKAEATTIREDADEFPEGTNIIYAGDFNSYTYTEEFYREVLLGTGRGKAIDPIDKPGSWDSNEKFAAIHTQSPAIVRAFPNQTLGGVDSRFDFQLVSEEFADGAGLEVVRESYHAFGNNGTTYNMATNDESNTIWSQAGNPLNPARGEILDALTSASDHLPVVVDYRVVSNLGAGITITQSGGSTDVTEGDVTDKYSIVLNSRPNERVTVTLGWPNSQLGLAPPALEFTSDDWSTPQEITVTAVDDSLLEGLHSALITHAVSSDDSSYDSIDVPNVLVQITDNDSTGGGNDFVDVTFSSTELTILESDDDDSYRVTLSAAPNAEVTITLNPDSSLDVSTTELVFDQNNWNDPQTVTVKAKDNAVPQPNRLLAIQHTVGSDDARFDELPVPDVGVFVIDDDNLRFVAGTGGADQISLLFSGTSVKIVVNNKATSYPITSFLQIVVFSGAGNDKVQLVDPTTSPVWIFGEGEIDRVQVDGRATANSFDVDSSDLIYNGSLIYLYQIEDLLLNGKGASDTLTVENLPNFNLSFQGGGGPDWVIGPDQDSTWRISGANAGKLGNSIGFASVESLTGGAHNEDTFIFGAGKNFNGWIDGGGGNDTIDLSAYKSLVTANLQTSTVTGMKGFQNINKIIGGSGSDKLIGRSISNTWKVTGANAVELEGITFSSFENLTGGTSSDAFVFANGAIIKGKLDGGLGNDTLDLNSYLSAVVVNLQAKSAKGTAGWLNIEEFIGGTMTNTIIGANKPNSWYLTSPNSGSVGTVTFRNFANLTGGTLADTFSVLGTGDWSGVLDGGAGFDTLLAPSTLIAFRSFKNIEKTVNV